MPIEKQVIIFVATEAMSRTLPSARHASGGPLDAVLK
jgi:hypothetical protein